MYYKKYAINKLANIIPVSDLRQDAATILKKINENNEPLVITQRGRATAVLIGDEAYEKFEHEKELLRLLAKRDKGVACIYFTRYIVRIVY